MALVLTACGPATNPAARPGPAASVAETGYAPPPAVISSTRTPDGRIALTGAAPPGSRVRLATPAGEAIFTAAGADGGWRLELPPAGQARLFGLSATTTGRPVQAEGYLALTPNGEAAQLRSGSGAVALVGAGVSGLLAADFDRKGGAVLSGAAPAGSAVSVEVDGRPNGSVKADGHGRFMVALNEPLKPGAHAIAVQARGVRSERMIVISTPPKLTAGPFEAQGVDGGWRIDWLTPGGGVQSTVLFAASGPSA